MSNLTRTPPGVGDLIDSASKRRREEVNKQTLESWDNSRESDLNSLTLGAAVKMLMGQFTETRAMIDGLRTDINTKIDAVKTELEEKLNDVKHDINSLKVVCATNDAALKSINDRFGCISQNVGSLELRNELIISGIPYQTGENLHTFLQAICKELLPTTSINQMASCRRMKPESRKKR